MPVTNSEKRDLLLILYDAFAEVFRRHVALFTKKVSERDVCAHILSVMERLMETRNYWFRDYYVDVEYNRGPECSPKIAMLRGGLTNVVPDIIIHGRGERGPLENLLCVEVKKSWSCGSSKENDKNRLRAFTRLYDDELVEERRHDEVDNYVLGVYLEYSVDGLEIFEVFYQGSSLGAFRHDGDLQDGVDPNLMFGWFLSRLAERRLFQ